MNGFYVDAEEAGAGGEIAAAAVEGFGEGLTLGLLQKVSFSDRGGDGDVVLEPFDDGFQPADPVGETVEAGSPEDVVEGFDIVNAPSQPDLEPAELLPEKLYGRAGFFVSQS